MSVEVLYIAQGYFGFPGTKDLWGGLRDYFPTISDIFDAALDDDRELDATVMLSSAVGGTQED